MRSALHREVATQGPRYFSTDMNQMLDLRTSHRHLPPPLSPKLRRPNPFKLDWPPRSVKVRSKGKSRREAALSALSGVRGVKTILKTTLSPRLSFALDFFLYSLGRPHLQRHLLTLLSTRPLLASFAITSSHLLSRSAQLQRDYTHLRRSARIARAQRLAISTSSA